MPLGPGDVYGYGFGPFRVDLTTGQLWNNGTRLKLQEQPFQLLVALLEHPGEVVSREDLQNRLWPADTFGDFEQGLNVAVQKLRVALGDSPEHPSYVETLARRGYRLIVPVQVVNGDGVTNGLAPPVPALVDTAPASGWAVRRGLLAGTALAVVALAAGVFTWLSRPTPVNFPKRGWVLIAKFENRTSETIFDDTVEYALERELSNSRFVNVTPPERVGDVLALMRKPRDTRLDASLAREVALRDGNVHVVLNGRTERLGSAYVLSAAVIDPATGGTLRSFSEQAASEQAVLGAVRRLSNEVRDSLGEELSPVRKDLRALERATTPSLRALQHYSKGVAFVNQYEWRAAANLFEQALAVDPDFASAHIYLAHCYSNLSEPEKASPHYQRAFQSAGTTSDPERYFILASYYERFAEDYEKAIQSYEVLVRLYPDHYWAVNNLALTLDQVGRSREAVPYFVARAELRPNDFDSTYDAWWALRRFNRDPVQAERLLARARRLASAPNVREVFPMSWVELQFSLVDEQLQRGEFGQALQETDRLAGTLETQSGSVRAEFIASLGDRYLALGRLREAEKYIRQSLEGRQYLRLAELADFRGDDQAMRYYLQKLIGAHGPMGPATAARLARAGLRSNSEELVSKLASKGNSPCSVQYANSELALARGETLKAVQLLQGTLEPCWQNRDHYSVLVSEALARALVRQGNVPAAVEVLQQGSSEYIDAGQLAVLPRQKYRLLQLYRRLGREGDARRVEADIRRLLAVADSDHPILLALDGRLPQGRLRPPSTLPQAAR